MSYRYMKAFLFDFNSHEIIERKSDMADEEIHLKNRSFRETRSPLRWLIGDPQYVTPEFIEDMKGLMQIDLTPESSGNECPKDSLDECPQYDNSFEFGRELLKKR